MKYWSEDERERHVRKQRKADIKARRAATAERVRKHRARKAGEIVPVAPTPKATRPTHFANSDRLLQVANEELALARQAAIAAGKAPIDPLASHGDNVFALTDDLNFHAEYYALCEKAFKMSREEQSPYRPLLRKMHFIMHKGQGQLWTATPEDVVAAELAGLLPADWNAVQSRIAMTKIAAEYP